MNKREKVSKLGGRRWRSLSVMVKESSQQSGVSNVHALVSRRFHGPVYFWNGFGPNFEYVLNSTNWSAKPTDLTNALIDMVEILLSREKVP